MGNEISTNKKITDSKPLQRLSSLFKKSDREEGIDDDDDERVIETDDHTCSNHIGDVTVSFVKGDIAQQKADVIVCGDPGDVDPSKTVIGRALLEKAGTRFQKDCQKKYPSGIQVGEIASTCSGNLKCKRVYHVCLPSKETKDKQTVLSRCIYKCLEKASSDNCGSIAFPALGSGVMGISMNRVAKLFYEAIDSFTQAHTDSSLKCITCVIFPDHRIDINMFAEEFRERVESPSEEKYIKRIGPLTVTIAQGDITQQKVDVIACAVGGKLNLKQTELGKVLLNKVGPCLQKECNEKYPSGINVGEIASTTPDNLPCKTLYLVCLPVKADQEKHTVITDVFFECLVKASRENHQSIAFPALGTGALGLSMHVAAKLFSKAIDSFIVRHTDSRLTDITCVIYPKHTSDVKSFAGEIHESLDRSKVPELLYSRDNVQIRQPHIDVDRTTVPELLYSRDMVQIRQPHIDVDTTPRTLSSVKFGNITVNLIVGSLTVQQCGVIVGTCTRKLELGKSAIGKAILHVAGPALQTQCSNKYPHGIQHGDVAVLSPHDMSCSCIYLVALPRYNTKLQIKILKSLVTGCLQQTYTDRQSFLSFPTLGTGYLRYPPEIAAETMLQAVSDFNTNIRGVTMTINIILHADGPTLQKNQRPFLAIFKQYSASSQSSCAEGASVIPERYTPEFCEYMYTRPCHSPEYWTHYTSLRPIKEWQIESIDQHGYRLVDLEEDQDEFQTVDNLVHNSWVEEHKGHGRDAKGLDELDFNEINVTKVQRLENVSLYEKYVTRRAELFCKAAKCGIPPELVESEDIEHGEFLTEQILGYLESSWLETVYDEVNEGYFFHGTKADKIENLLRQGIDVRMAQGGAVYGPAVYMAESSTKADQYTDERGNRKTNGLQMFLCRACLGEMKVMRTAKKFRRPPCKEGCEGDECSHDRYDSIVQEGKFIFREFIVYDTHQVYPEYIITYDRVITDDSEA